MILMNPDAKGRPSDRVSRNSRNTNLDDPGLEAFLMEILERFGIQIREMLPSFREAILSSAKDFLEDSRRDLERWTALLAAGSVSQEEFEWLVQARVHLAEMESLLAAGLTLARIDELRMTLVRSITGAAFHLIGI
jgi:hypothetical protein